MLTFKIIIISAIGITFITAIIISFINQPIIKEKETYIKENKTLKEKNQQLISQTQDFHEENEYLRSKIKEYKSKIEEQNKLLNNNQLIKENEELKEELEFEKDISKRKIKELTKQLEDYKQNFNDKKIKLSRQNQLKHYQTLIETILTDDLLNNIPDNFRETIKLYYLKGYSINQISTTTGLSRKTIDTHIKVQARRYIKYYLRKHIEEAKEYYTRQYQNLINTFKQLCPEKYKLILPINDILNLSTRSKNILKVVEIEYIIDLTDWSRKDLLKLRNLGEKCVNEIENELHKHNLKLNDND